MKDTYNDAASAGQGYTPVALDAEAVTFLHAASMAMSAVAASQQLGVFRRLTQGPADLDTLIADCQMGQHGARLLLIVLANLGLVSIAADGVYHLTMPTLVMASAPRENLAELIRNDYTPTAGDTQAGAEKLYPDIVAMLGAWFAPAAQRAAAVLDTANLRVLDVGAGAAPWSLAFALRDPGCQVTAVDLPAASCSIQGRTGGCLSSCLRRCVQGGGC